MDNNNRVAELDRLGYIPILALEHHQVHEGDFYTFSDYDNNVQVASPKEWLITTPDTSIRFHCKINIDTDTGSLLEFYENPNVTWASGVVVVGSNNDRNSTNVCSVVCSADPTIAVVGAPLLQVSRVGAGREKKIGGVARERAEWILKQNEDYLVRITVDANGADVSFNLEGYEVG